MVAYITLTEIQLIQRSDSIIYPFMYYMSTWNATSISGSANYSYLSSIIDTGGVSRISTVPGPTLASGAGNTSYGIVVGTGTNPNTGSTYALQAPIANGTGAGQLQYGTTGVSAPGVSGSIMTVIVNRTLTNSSGGTVTISETAIYGALWWPGTQYFFALTRDVLATSISLANGGSATIYYTFQVTIS